MPVKENFCKKIREEKNMKQAELAKKVNVIPATINGFEKMRHNLSNAVVIKIANVLGVRPEEEVPTIIIAKTIANQDVSEKYKKKAIKLTDDYFKNDLFDKKALIKIANEVYNFLVLYNNISSNEVAKNLQKDFYRGLAAKCFLDYIKENKK